MRMIKRIVTIIVVNIKFSVLVTHEESTSLLIEVRLGISIVKDIPKYPDVCRDWRQLYWPCSGVGSDPGHLDVRRVMMRWWQRTDWSWIPRCWWKPWQR